jgi:hypothetical protein
VSEHSDVNATHCCHSTHDRAAAEEYLNQDDGDLYDEDDDDKCHTRAHVLRGSATTPA